MPHTSSPTDTQGEESLPQVNVDGSWPRKLVEHHLRNVVDQHNAAMKHIMDMAVETDKSRIAKQAELEEANQELKKANQELKLSNGAKSVWIERLSAEMLSSKTECDAMVKESMALKLVDVEHKYTNKELQHDNEELKRTNEGLKHTNEELKLSNDELKGLNEGLKHADEEQKLVIEELKHANEQKETAMVHLETMFNKNLEIAEAENRGLKEALTAARHENKGFKEAMAGMAHVQQTTVSRSVLPKFFKNTSIMKQSRIEESASGMDA